MTHYTIIGQRKLKGRADVIGARRHNLREKLLPNVRLDGPPPVVVRGTADTWADISARIAAAGVTPHQGAVLGIEVLLTTSPDWWSTDELTRSIQVATVERLVIKYAEDRFDREAIAQIVRHEDETTPHWHLAVAALERKVDGRRKDKAPRLLLNAAGMVGHKPQMAAEHTRWASICGHLGLVRGRERSGEKNKPNHVYRAEMAAAIAEANASKAKADARDMAAIMAEADALGERDRYRSLAAEAESAVAAVREDRIRLDADRAALEARAADLAAQQTAIDARAAELIALRENLVERSERAAKWTKASKAKEARLEAEAARIACEDERVRQAGADNIAEVMQVERIEHLLRSLVVSDDSRAREAVRLVDQLRAHVDKRAREDPVYERMLRVARAARLSGESRAA